MDASKYRTPTAEEVYFRYADMLFRIAFSILLSKEDAEDAVSDAFSVFIKKAPAIYNIDHEKAWFVRVTVNKCRDLQRKRVIRAYTPLEEIAEIPAGENDTSEILDDVLALPDKYKTAILLCYFEDFSIEQISKVLKISKSGVKMRLARGREMLRGETDKRG